MNAAINSISDLRVRVNPSNDDDVKGYAAEASFILAMVASVATDV